MLSRAVLPLARTRPLPPTIRLSLANSQLRWYAKINNKAKAAYKLPDSFKSSKSGTRAPSSAANESNNPSRQPNVSKRRPELETRPKSSENTVPQSAGAGAGVNDAKTPGSSQPNQPNQSPERIEFETVANLNESTSSQPQKPLPDLTQGIPSTLAAELEAASLSDKRGSTALNLTEDPSRGEGYGDDDGGNMPKDAYVSSLDRRRARLLNIMYLLILGGAVGGTVYLGRNWETDEEARVHTDAPSGWGTRQFYNRIKARLNDLTSYYKDPAFEKLLPDEDPQFRQPYTLVLSLEDLLVHSEWSREHGWRVAKRPGVDYFLRYLNQYYELVLFTSVPSMMADQVLKKLDPYRIIRWPLFREATKYKDGEYVKVSLKNITSFLPRLLPTEVSSTCLGSVISES
jgi:mitochondrial import inner membrane translocase subunit TIM50